MSKQKVPCGGFQIGEGLTLEKNVLKATSTGGGQSDWNQNDETAADYIKNRPGGYSVFSPLELFSETFESGKEIFGIPNEFKTFTQDNNFGQDGITFNIKIDDGEAKDYTAPYVNSGATSQWTVGDSEFSQLDFYMVIESIVASGTSTTFYFKDGGSHTCVVKELMPHHVAIEDKFLPNSSWKNTTSSSVTLTDTKSTIFETDSGNEGLYAVFLGKNNTTRYGVGDYNLFIGRHLQKEGDKSIILGQYNDVSNLPEITSKNQSSSNARIVIGNGTDGAPHTSFMVLEDGTIVMGTTGGNYYQIGIDDTSADSPVLSLKRVYLS